MEPVDEAPGRYLRLRWPAIATTSIVVAIGSLGTLVIVASVRDAELLSVVALALAILAFVIQIIVFLSQTWASSQQVTQAQAVNAETKVLLSELQAQARVTNTVLNDQYNKLLDRLLLLTKDGSTASGGSDPGDSLREVQARLVEEILRARPLAESAALPRTPITQTSPMAGNPREWPPPSVLARLANLGLADLGEDARRMLNEFAEDWDLSIRREVPDGLARNPEDPSVQELLSLGLIVGRTTFADGTRFFVLTGLGRAAARLFLAPPPAPDAALRLFPWLGEERNL